MKNPLEMLKEIAHSITKDDVYKMYDAACKMSNCSIFEYVSLNDGGSFGDIRKVNKLVYMKTYRTMTCMYINIGSICYHIVIKCNDSKVDYTLDSMYKSITT